jgi:DNA-binding transcriptional MerR regulator/effector-binding domain-containing protein
MNRPQIIYVASYFNQSQRFFPDPSRGWLSFITTDLAEPVEASAAASPPLDSRLCYVVTVGYNRLSEAAMLQIGEFSQLGQVTVRTLRHYAQLGLLEPAHVDSSSGYRYYHLDQLPQLHRILALKDLGFPLDQVKGLLEEGVEVDRLQDMLLSRQSDLERELADNQRRLGQVEARLAMLRQGSRFSDDYDVLIKSTPGFYMLGVRQIVPTVDQIGHYCDLHLTTLRAALKKHRLTPAGGSLNLYHMDEYRENDLDVESGLIIEAHPDEDLGDGIYIRQETPVEYMASLVCTTSFAILTESVLALLQWVAVNGYSYAGPLREIHLFGNPLQVDENEEVVLELQIPVAKRDRDRNLSPIPNP